MCKKFFRGVGYFFCAALLLMCIMLAVLALGFGPQGTVGLFGFDLYVVDADEIEAVPAGSVVIARDCRPYDLDEGALALYNRNTDGVSAPALGYVDAVRMDDGVYYISVSVGDNSYEFSEHELIGSAEKSSEFLGAVIAFSKRPEGIFTIAFLPCAALILYDIIRSFAARRPIPEVVPQVKNAPAEEEPAASGGISVRPEGSAAYSRSGGAKSPVTADSVLFSYAGKQRRPDIIPLTDRKPDSKNPAEKSGAVVPEKSERQEQPDAADSAKAAAVNPVSVPAPTAIKRYIDNAVRADGATAELPVIPKKKATDAFFSQSDAPQIAPHRSGSSDKNVKAVIDLEDALATAEERTHRPQRENGRRSAEILAAKSVNDLISEDDDSLDKSRYEIDDILAGLDKRKGAK